MRPFFIAPYDAKFGGAKRDRTADLNTASVALSQLSYSPDIYFEASSAIINGGLLVKP